MDGPRSDYTLQGKVNRELRGTLASPDEILPFYSHELLSTMSEFSNVAESHSSRF